MNNKNFSVNIDAEAVKTQYEQEQKTFTSEKCVLPKTMLQ